jgi:hypothetical protein
LTIPPQRDHFIRESGALWMLGDGAGRRVHAML